MPRITLLGLVLTMLLLAGCVARTVTPDELVAMEQRDAGMKLYKPWWYMGSDDRYHYFVRGSADGPTRRVPIDDLSSVKALAFDLHRPVRVPIDEHFPQLYPWLSRQERPTIDDSWIDALRMMSPDTPFSGDASPTMAE